MNELETRPRRILVVDDEANVLSALRRALRRDGYEVFVADSGAAGLEELKRSSPIDMIISDHLMPDQTGLEFLKLARDRHPDAVRIMLTGHADMQTAIDAINQGEIYRFLTKPWDDATLKVTIWLAFEHQQAERENRRLLALVRRQERLLASLEKRHPHLKSIIRDESGAILLPDVSPGTSST